MSWDALQYVSIYFHLAMVYMLEYNLTVCLTVHVLVVVHAVIPTTNRFSFSVLRKSVIAALVNISSPVSMSKVLKFYHQKQVVK